MSSSLPGPRCHRKTIILQSDIRKNKTTIYCSKFTIMTDGERSKVSLAGTTNSNEYVNPLKSEGVPVRAGARTKINGDASFGGWKWRNRL
jgi:hypothetical protein